MPPLAIALALSSALIHAGWNAALKGGRDRITDSFLVAVGSIIGGATFILLLGPPPPAAWPYVAVSVVLHLLYWTALFKAYDAGDLSHIYTLSRGSAPLLVAFGAAATAHEIPPPLKAVGILLVSLGVLAVGASPRAPLRATLWALATGACIASYSLVDALGSRIAGNAARFLGVAQVLAALAMIAFALWRRGARRLVADSSVAPIRGVAIGLLSIGGYALVLWAQTMAPIAQVTALRETSVVWGALIAFAVLRERLGVRRWIGALIVAAGAGLIAFA